LIACVWLGIPADLSAQSRGVRFGSGIQAGLSSYDLDGTGTAFVSGLVIYATLLRPLIVEAAIPFYDYSRDAEGFPGGGSNRTRFLLPEVSLQVQAHSGRFRPYLAAGAGGALRLNGNVSGGGTLHAATGLRALVKRAMLLRGEVRARSIRPWSGSTVDFTIGIEWARE
jgi:hypothetical protein